MGAGLERQRGAHNSEHKHVCIPSDLWWYFGFYELSHSFLRNSTDPCTLSLGMTSSMYSLLFSDRLSHCHRLYVFQRRMKGYQASSGPRAGDHRLWLFRSLPWARSLFTLVGDVGTDSIASRLPRDLYRWGMSVRHRIKWGSIAESSYTTRG